MLKLDTSLKINYMEYHKSKCPSDLLGVNLITCWPTRLILFQLEGVLGLFLTHPLCFNVA